MQLPDEANVLVLLVATDGARWLPQTLRGLRAQKHRPMKILAVDNASSDGSGEMLAKAFGPRRVVTLERRVGYGRALAAALKVAAERSMEADAFLLLHDDAVLGEGTLEAMVDVLRKPDVGIVGCKLLDADDPSILQDIGRTTDRYGRAVPRVERGELDQGQYEGIEDVLYASSAALLVAREVVERVGLFDTRYVVLRDDLDLCWRARLAGYRTLVTTDVAARHVRAGDRELRDAPPKNDARYYADRNMIATLLKNYSLARLAVALPVTVLISLSNVILFLLTGRRRSAVHVLKALQWNMAHLPSTVRARSRTQAMRRIPDSTIAGLMHHGATRLRAQFERVAETVMGTVGEGDEDQDAEPPRLLERLLRHPTALFTLVSAALVLVAARGVFGSEQLAGADLAPFPDQARDLFASYASGWRGPPAGGAAPATPALALLGGLVFLTFGSGWIAQRVLLFGLPILGGWMLARLGRTLGLSAPARRAAGVTYTLTPLVLGAYGEGRLSDLVLLAAAPGLIVSLLRAGSVLPRGGWRSLAAGIAGLAVTAAFAPWALVLVAAGGVLMAVASAVRAGPVFPVLRRTMAMLVGAVAMLFPWSIELFRTGSPMMGGPTAPVATMPELVALSPLAIRPLPVALSFGVAVLAAAGAIVARGERRPIVAPLIVIGGGGLFAAWAVARGIDWIAPSSAVPLAATTACAVALAAIGLEETIPALRARHVGLLHVGAALAGVLMLVQLGAAVVWVAKGERPGVVASGTLVPSFFASEGEAQGTFRILWLSGTRADPEVALTGPAGSTIRQFLPRIAGAGADALRATTTALAAGSGDAVGRMLATLGVRFVIVRPEVSAELADAVAAQTDLAFSQRFRDATIYRNAVDVPVAAVVTAGGWIKAAREPSLDALAAAGPDPRRGRGFTRVSPETYQGTATVRPGELLVAEDFSQGWSASAGGRAIAPARSFGWATRFSLEGGGVRVRVSWSGQRWHRAALVAQVVLIAGFALWWSQRAARERGER